MGSFYSFGNLPLISHPPQISPPTSLNFSTNAEIFSNTVRFFVLYRGLRGLIFGSVAFSAVPFSDAYSRFNEALI